MSKRDGYPLPNTNLCVVYEKQFGHQARKTSCKKMPAVETLAEAKQAANRIASKLKLKPGNAIAITLGRKHEGRVYWFHVEHGRISCRVGAMYGPKCNKR